MKVFSKTMFSCWGCSGHNPQYRESLLYHRELFATRSDFIWSLSKRLCRLEIITNLQLDRVDKKLNRISDMWYGQFSDNEAKWLVCVEMDVDFGPEKMKEICDLLDQLYYNVKKFDNQKK